MIKQDYRQRFVFDGLDVRGCIVRLQETTSQVQATHHYPPALAVLLNEFTLAAVLLRDSIKTDGGLTIQLRTPGAIQLIIADCMADGRVRAISEYDNAAISANEQIKLKDLGAGSVLAITISPEQGERYQSIVPIERETLSACLEDYFDRSEQLSSRFKLLANSAQGLGVALHALPQEKITDKEQAQQHFDRLNALLKTLSLEEGLTLASDSILTRLFHEEQCRLFNPNQVEFGCPCSKQKSLDSIAAIGKDEVLELIHERKQNDESKVVIDCHFCFQRYDFDFATIMALFD